MKLPSPPPPQGAPLDGAPPPPSERPIGSPLPPTLQSPDLPLSGRVWLAQTQRTAEELSEEKRENRLALRRLAASPELMAVSVTFLLCFGLAIRLDPVGLIFGLLLYGIFGWILLSTGNSVAASLLLGALGLSTAGMIAERFDVEDDSLWWMIPALVIVIAEAAISYNHFRRRQSDISMRISQTVAINTASVIALSVVLATLTRWLTQVDGRVEWPWYATTIVGLCACWFAGLIVIRRTATPAERRRFDPGRRMLPPPR